MIAILYLWLFLQPTDTIKVQVNPMKADMQEAIMEFAKDLKLNPDSLYMPFKADTIKKEGSSLINYNALLRQN